MIHYGSRKTKAAAENADHRGNISAEVQVLNAKKKNKLKTQGSTCRKIHVKKGAQ